MSTGWKYSRPLKEKLMALEEPGKPLPFDAARGLVDEVTAQCDIRALVDGLKQKLKQGDRILIPRAETAPGDLRDAGLEVDEVPAYRTLPGSGNIHLAKKLLEDGKIHILTFTSASTVTNFVDMIEADDMAKLLKGVLVACIGPVTARTARDLGLPVQVVADKHTIEGMVDSILTYANEM